MAKKSTPDDPRIAEASAWQGTEPVGGTRRRVVLDAIRSVFEEVRAKGNVLEPGDELDLADDIELALLEAAEKDGPPIVDGAETWQFEYVEANDPMTDDDPKWRWRLNAAGETVASSEGYATKKEAEKKAEAFQTHAARAGFPLVS